MNVSAERLAAAVDEAVALIRAGWSDRPRAAMILGTGLGRLTDSIEIEAEWNYCDLPHFARSTADGHRGRLLAGRLGGVSIVAMDGRFHAYEGYSFQQITFPIRVLAALDPSFLMVSNASGGLNSALCSGDILLIQDHINFMGSAFGQASRSCCHDRPAKALRQHSAYYDAQLLTLAEQIASDERIPVRRGTYIAMLGPNYETRAEYRWLRTLGDVVGMSTVPEVLVAQELNLPVIAFSIVTNVFSSENAQQTTSQEVVCSAASAAPNLRQLVVRLLDFGDGLWDSVAQHETSGQNPQPEVSSL